jgi:O-antigen ligase
MGAHNVFLTMLLDLGAVGLAIFVLLLSFVLRAVLSMPKNERMVWLAATATWGLFAMIIGSPTDKTMWFVFAMVLAQARLLRNRRPARANAVRMPPRANRVPFRRC